MMVRLGGKIKVSFAERQFSSTRFRGESKPSFLSFPVTRFIYPERRQDITRGSGLSEDHPSHAPYNLD